MLALASDVLVNNNMHDSYIIHLRWEFGRFVLAQQV